MIVAKFTCTQVSRFPGDREEVSLSAVVAADGKGNESWAKYTPSGELSMTIDNPEAQGKFEPGADYMLRIEPA